MATAGRFVLENKKGEVVRTFAVDSNEIFLIYNEDSRRVELVSSLETLKSNKTPYTLLKKTTVGGAKRRPTVLSNGSRFLFMAEIEKTAQLVQINDDSEEQEKAIYKNTAYTQLGLMVFVLIMGLLVEPFFMHKPEEVIVTVIPQTFIPKKEQITLKAAEKVQPHKRVAKKKVVSKVKHVSKVLTKHVKARRKENAPLRTKIKVENVGALGALGGKRNGSKNSAGFNMNALNDSKGTSWNGAGSGGVGGMERAIHGQGLVASAAGSGGQVQGGGGYGTRGKAGGGRAGYGSMNMGGSAAAYFEPVQEEATVEGGLDKDQIAAVINRHIGEVIYCYEKGLQVKSGLSGRVGVKFVINGSGIVSTAGIASSSLKNAQVEGCIVSHLRNWKFPKPIGGVNVKVQYPFMLKRMNHG